MKSIDFIFVGKSKNAAFAALEKEYHAKIHHHLPSSHIEIIRDAPADLPEDKRREKDAKSIAALCTKSDVLIACDETGQSLDTIILSRKLRGWYELGQRVIFAVGGAYGMDLAALPANKTVLRLSDLTLPHELARIVLLEQVYRCLTLWAGTGYHHG